MSILIIHTGCFYLDLTVQVTLVGREPQGSTHLCFPSPRIALHATTPACFPICLLGMELPSSCYIPSKLARCGGIHTFISSIQVDFHEFKTSPFHLVSSRPAKPSQCDTLLKLSNLSLSLSFPWFLFISQMMLLQQTPRFIHLTDLKPTIASPLRFSTCLIKFSFNPIISKQKFRENLG